MEIPIYKCMTKTTTAEDKNLRYSLNWAVSRRAILKVTPDALVYGDWTIPYNQIDEAILFLTLPGSFCLVTLLTESGNI